MTYGEILKSTRFQQLALLVVLWVATQIGWVPQGDISVAVQGLMALLTASVGVGTVDRFGEKVGNK